MGIVELGEKTFTSTTTVKSFCRKLGVDSYTGFPYAAVRPRRITTPTAAT